MQEQLIVADAKRTDNSGPALSYPVIPFIFVAVSAVVISVATSAQTSSTAATSLTLDQAIAEAVERNLELLAARTGITVADANVITARLRPNSVLR